MVTVIRGIHHTTLMLTFDINVDLWKFKLKTTEKSLKFVYYAKLNSIIRVTMTMIDVAEKDAT